MNGEREICRVALPISLQDFVKMGALSERYHDRDLELRVVKEGAIDFIAIVSKPKAPEH